MAKKTVKKDKSFESMLVNKAREAQKINHFVEKKLGSAYPLFVSLSMVTVIFSIFAPNLSVVSAVLALILTAYIKFLERDNKENDLFAKADAKLTEVSKELVSKVKNVKKKEASKDEPSKKVVVEEAKKDSKESEQEKQ